MTPAKPATKVTIQINKQPFHLDVGDLEPADFRDKVNAPADYEVWRITKDADPEGQLPKDDVQITSRTPITNGERYRVVPPGTFGRL